MDKILRPWRHYVDFSGRSTRTEYWLFFIVNFAVLMLLILVPAAMSGAGLHTSEAVRSGALAPIVFAPALLFMVAALIPSISVTVRRLHDSDKSGWLYLLTFVPYVGWVFFIVIGCWRGTFGENSYGFDPRRGEGAPDYDAPEIFS